MVKSKILKKIYLQSPRFIKNLAETSYISSKHYLFYGPPFLRWIMFLKKSGRWSSKEIEDYQLMRLKYVLDYAYTNLPYYHALFKKIGFKPSDFKSVKDLVRIPILTKDIIKKQPEDFIAKSFRGHYGKLVNSPVSEYPIIVGMLKMSYKSSTGGTTGNPMSVYECVKSRSLYSALLHNWMTSVGAKTMERKVLFDGKYFLEQNITYQSYEHIPILRLLYISSFNLSWDNVKECLENINRFDPYYAYGNPSVMFFLTRASKELGVPIKLKCFISACEKLLPEQRKEINESGCEVFDFYSSTEHVTSAFECREHNGLHVNMEQGYMEVVDSEGGQLGFDETGSIVGTGFYNSVMPLIRYNLNDEGILSEGDCGCGRKSLLLKEVLGRTTDSLSYNGRTISSATLSLAFQGFDEITESQLVQKGKNLLLVDIVINRNKDFSQTKAEQLAQNLQCLVGDCVDIKIRFVTKILRTDRGKYFFIKHQGETQD